MKIEVLIATMHRKEFSFLETINLQSDALIINQCDEEKIEEIDYNGYHVKMISTKERGLSRSRNMALKYAKGDICLIADDDITYIDGYVDIVKSAFEEIKDADVLTFCAERVQKDGRVIVKDYPEQITKRNKLSVGRATSYEIAFLRNKIIEKKIQFDIHFGTGSKEFLHGEENIFLRDCIGNKLNIYFCPKLILKTYEGDSTWFKGYDKKFFFDSGAIWERNFKRVTWFFILSTVIRKRNLYKSDFTSLEILKEMLKGRKHYRHINNM